MTNRLATATSPYLLQHQANPVAWQPWDAAALADARAQDRPILLSVGYAACHWCHVMAHESFEDDAIADLMNRHFVNIKVDREERPDLDQIYQHALALLGQQGGWPLTMFLTPDGKPFWGGTYFPPQSRYGRPGFPEVLTTIARIWQDERHKVDGNTVALADALQRLATPERADRQIDDATGAATAQRILQAFDREQGGLGGAPKFPQAPILELLWRHGQAGPDPALAGAVAHTLARICQGGIYDHVGGGFARYAVDDQWLVPHFEKMLYDNAQLLSLLADVHAATGNPLFAARARETVAWLQREMMVEDGFASSLDADSEGEEGKFYIWNAGEIDAVLDEAAPAFRAAYGVTEGGNFEGSNVLNRLHQPGLGDAAAEAALQAARERLLTARAARPRPARDDKVLADWNGLMIAALARAGAVLAEPDWLALARRAFTFVTGAMADGDRLRHSWRAGRTLDRAFLDDYAQMAAAAVTLFEHTGDGAYLERARAWIALLDRDYRTADGAYCLVAGDAADVLVRAKSAQDGPTPAANGTLLAVLARLGYLTGESAYHERARALIAAFSGEALRHPALHAALLCGVKWLEQPVQIALIGMPGSADLEALRQTALAGALPQVILQTVAPDAMLPAGHPATGKTMVEGRATAYVCPGQTCRLPITEPAALRDALAAPALGGSAAVQ